MSRYLDYCLKKKLATFSPDSIEGFILQMYHSGDKKQNPEGFRSAVRKIANLLNQPDPITPLARMLIKAFYIDYSKKEKRRFTKEDLQTFFDFCNRFTKPLNKHVFILFQISLWQNLRLDSLVKLRINDCFDDSIYVHAKNHPDPIITIIHPYMKNLLNELREFVPKDNLRVADGIEYNYFNIWLEKKCRLANIPIHTWHDIRHTITQMMNDLGYPSKLMQALGCWNDGVSMKSYVRERVPTVYNKAWTDEHDRVKRILAERLRKVRGKMIWFKAND